MAAPLRIYLSGSIKKGSSDSRADDAFWTEAHEREIRQRIEASVKLLNPAKTPIRRNNYFVNFGCDLQLVGSSDIVLVDLRMEKGIGVGAELMYARQTMRPVVAWIPRNTYYRRDKVENVFGEDLIDWVHPFAFGLCDVLAETLPEACAAVKTIVSERRGKDPSKAPEAAIEAYLDEYGDLSAK